MSADTPGAQRHSQLQTVDSSAKAVSEVIAQPGLLDTAIARTRDFLLDRQQPDGHWVAELEGDTILESEYILLLAFLGAGNSEPAQAAARYLLANQSPDGSWGNFPGGPIDVSAAAKAYLALRITGHPADHPALVRAREAILAAGGVERVNSFTRFYFAMLGLIPYRVCAAVPPELILIPNWAPFNIYEMSAWSRTIIVPLSLLWACQPVTRLPEGVGIAELYVNPQREMPRYIRGVNATQNPGWFDWTRFFEWIDGGVKTVESLGLKPFRGRALKLAEQWILEHLEESDGLGAIFPPIIWTIIGLRCLGYRDDSPVIQSQQHELERLVIREHDQLRLQPCLSPVWDTAITLIALRDAGVPRTDAAIQRGLDWLMSKEAKRPGDYQRLRPQVPVGGWYFEYRNEFYPDFDDTAMVLITCGKMLPEGMGHTWTLEWPSQGTADSAALIKGLGDQAQTSVAEIEMLQKFLQPVKRGADWLKGMQSQDGGWGAFDADNTREIYTKVPFADHNAMIDPSSADITARILEAAASIGLNREEPWLQKALQYVWDDQAEDGAWFGRWGVNYIYGTWQVLQGLTKFGISPQDSRLQRGAHWLISKQQSCGGWGETPATYDDPSLRGTGTPTASQTAWALLGLIAAGRAQSDAVTRGVQFLLDRQQSDGSWIEPEFTGTGFPRVFYLRYHYYRIYFPLMALSRYRAALGQPA